MFYPLFLGCGNRFSCPAVKRQLLGSLSSNLCRVKLQTWLRVSAVPAISGPFAAVKVSGRRVNSGRKQG